MGPAPQFRPRVGAQGGNPEDYVACAVVVAVIRGDTCMATMATPVRDWPLQKALWKACSKPPSVTQRFPLASSD